MIPGRVIPHSSRAAHPVVSNEDQNITRTERPHNEPEAPTGGRKCWFNHQQGQSEQDWLQAEQELKNRQHWLQAGREGKDQEQTGYPADY